MKKYYPEDSYVAGETPSTQDIKTTITADNARVNVLSLISVFVVVMFSFQSVLVPIIVMILLRQLFISIWRCLIWLARRWFIWAILS